MSTQLLQEWNNEQPATNRLLVDFYIKLAAKELAYKSRQREHYYYQPTQMKKNYNHFGNTTRVDFVVTAIGGIAWIENLLNQSEGITEVSEILRLYLGMINYALRLYWEVDIDLD